jgi:formylmethanofuran dehydrogenase subunit B
MATDVVCPFCGTLCDDLEVIVEDNKIKNVRHACVIGSSKFLATNELKRPGRPMIRRNGSFEEVGMKEAIDECGKILSGSKRPLLYGWSSTGCEAHSVGIELTEELGGVIDSTTSVCHGPSILAIQDVGYPSATLGDVKNRADLIIYWGSNPMHAHPRHLSRYSVFPRGYFRERGQLDRELIVVDVRKTDTAKLASRFVQVRCGEDYELLSALRFVVNGGGELEADEVAGVSREDILDLADRLKNCQYGVLFFGMGLTQSSGTHRNIDAGISLVRDLNHHTKFSIMAMRGHYNVTGIGEVMTWQTGYPFAVDFSRGYPRYNPGETTANDILRREEADAALIIASDPVAHFPKTAVENLTKIPIITIGPDMTPTAMLSDVFIPSSISGIEDASTAYRMDTVPLKLHRVLEPPEGICPDVEILQMILENVREKKGGVKKEGEKKVEEGR